MKITNKNILADEELTNFLNEELKDAPEIITLEDIINGKVDIKIIDDTELNDLVSDASIAEDFAYGTEEEEYCKTVYSKIKEIVEVEKFRRNSR